jgi:transcriptional regulator with XRE-family HTH domain
MAERRLTQADVGKRIGMCQGTISKRLTGNVEWTVEELTRVAVALDVDLDRILPVPELQRLAS